MLNFIPPGEGLFTIGNLTDMGAQANIARGFRPGQKQSKSNGRGGDSSFHGDKSKLKCLYNGMSKHTMETCVPLVGYLDRCKDNHISKKKRVTGVVTNNATVGRAGENKSDTAVGSHEATNTSDVFQSQFRILRERHTSEVSSCGAYLAAGEPNPRRAWGASAGMESEVLRWE